ncbi:hypothetical protein ACMFMG_010244 [Clarireedia jacksonii]
MRLSDFGIATVMCTFVQSVQFSDLRTYSKPPRNQIPNDRLQANCARMRLFFLQLQGACCVRSDGWLDGAKQRLWILIFLGGEGGFGGMSQAKKADMQLGDFAGG